MIPAGTNTNCGIYRIYNKSNGKYYIGSSKDFKGRKTKHFYQLRKNIHKNDHLQSAWNLAEDKKIFEFQRFIYCSEKDLIPLEQKCIDIMNPEYNKSKIAGRPEHNEETRAKIAKTVGEYQRSLGENHSSKRPEVRAKVSAAHIGKPKTLESIEKQKATKSSPFYNCPNKSLEKRTKHSKVLLAKGSEHASKRPEVREKMREHWHTPKAIYLIWWRANAMHQSYWGA
jgi:group I intron endonuclease